ncbi:LysR family transcriptional regulator [Geodermatophilus sp. YIM 151500]|uniref:LysR family transcriptional regulator n=1 Tax=Geodermatophilus sp. YIM 151500 TaxID=2984531 RepID=UPI0021E44522|nr:LysR family transcriptional regulator [Geodermatophilus sp. YIM 151500]MCV2490964.1 LysR family transcriptional regulator [Geodermatophilus sp. YIM 151500]
MDVDLDLVKLRTLVEIRATGSMTAAAAALGYTTGAVSQQMAALQRSVRVELVAQVGRHVRLTDAGHLLADHAAGLLSLARQAEQALAGLPGRPQARVVVGVFGTAAAALLPPALVRVREQTPGVTLRSVEVDVDDATSAVAAGRVDLAFGVDYPQAPIPRASDVALVALGTERFSIATPAGSTAREGPSSLLDFAGEPWILPPEHTSYGRAVRMACRRLGFEPRVDHTVTDTASTLSLVAAGLGVAPVTDLMLELRRAGLVAVPLTDRVERTLVLAHRREPAPQPGVRAVVDAIRASVPGGRPG